MSDKKHLSTLCEELEEAASLSDDELGEWWSDLATLYPSAVDGASPEFLAAYEKEVRSEHARLKRDFRVVEKTSTTPVQSYTYRRELKHISELGGDE